MVPSRTQAVSVGPNGSLQLKCIQNFPQTIAANHLLMSDAICNLMTALAFPVWVKNFTSQAVLLYEGQIVGHAKRIQETMFAQREVRTQRIQQLHCLREALAIGVNKST